MPIEPPITGIRAFDAAKHPRDQRGRFSFNGGNEDVSVTLPSSATATISPEDYDRWQSELDAARQSLKNGADPKAVNSDAKRIQNEIVGQKSATAGKASEPSFVGKVSDDFKVKVNGALAAIPQEVRDEMSARGVKVVGADFISTHRPDLKNVEPRGWGGGRTWDYADGAYMTGSKEVVVSENRYITKTDPAFKSTRVHGNVLHEYGHAVDQNFSRRENLSNTSQFVAAYNNDVRNIAEGDKVHIRYFLQEGAAGREEAFAESFARIHGGYTGAPSTAQAFQKAFPRTMQAVSELIKAKVKK